MARKPPRFSTGVNDWSIRRRLAWQLTLAMGLILTLVFLVLDYAIDREMYARLDHFLNVRASALALQLQVRTPEQAAKNAGQPSMSIETIVLGLKVMLEAALGCESDIKAAAGTIC